MGPLALKESLSIERIGNVATGKVKWFNDQKGYGFIAQDNGGEDVFVHHSGINAKGHRTLNEGQSVKFETSKDNKGTKAVNVTVLS